MVGAGGVIHVAGFHWEHNWGASVLLHVASSHHMMSHSSGRPEHPYDMATGLQEKKFQEGMHQHTHAYQVSASVMLAYVPLAKAGDIANTKVNWRSYTRA